MSDFASTQEKINALNARERCVVIELCNRVGFGFVLQVAEREWRRRDPARFATLDAERPAAPEPPSAEGLRPSDEDVIEAMQSATRTIYAMVAELRETRAQRDALAAEVELDNKIIAERNRVLDALPCDAHGQCVPFALEEIERLERTAEMAADVICFGYAVIAPNGGVVSAPFNTGAMMIYGMRVEAEAAQLKGTTIQVVAVRKSSDDERRAARDAAMPRAERATEEGTNGQ